MIADRAVTGDPVVWHGIAIKPRRARITSFAECQKQIMSWLSDCQEDHEDCEENHRSPMPTRVIDVGTTGSQTIHLHETTGTQEDDYVALSHCWGDSATVPQTNSGNYHQHKDSIPISTLSNTFRDAIEVTRGLGFRYLWIDSLCIIQGDEEDWSREAAKMGQVYSQAVLTLAAVSATDGKGGLFQKPDIREIRLSHENKDELGCWLRLPFRDELYSTLHHTTNMTCEYALPLFDRKWTFQERLLSRRLLYFAEEEFAWECQEAIWCQCNHHKNPRIPNDSLWDVRGVAPSFKRAFTLAAMNQSRPLVAADLLGYERLPNPYARTKKAKTPLEASLEFWERIIKEYSVRKLTFAKDNLSALSGIAQGCASLGLGAYHGGTWNTQLPEALCWSQPWHMRRGPPPRPTTRHAPSWSWASSECPVDFAHVLRTYASVKSVVTKPHGPDKFGSIDIENSMLELEAPARAARLEQRKSGKIKGISQYRFHWPDAFDTDDRFFKPDFQLPPRSFDVWLAFVALGTGGFQIVVLVELPNERYERIGLLTSTGNKQNKFDPDDSKKLERKIFRII